jgi:transcriptional regulator of acetoin/glycerol metabolism
MSTARNEACDGAGALGHDVRDAFLASGTIRADIRDVVRESWVRSAKAGLDPSVLLPSHRQDEADPKVLAAVDAVLAQQLSHLGGEPIGLIFASPSGVILRQICPDNSMASALRKVSLEPGCGYSEQAVGTNGIGTTLQAQVPTLITGAEHFVDELTVFACAGAPVHHPVTRSVVGILDLTCSASRGNALLLSYAQTIAAQIEAELLQTVGAKQLALLRDYAAACRHATGPIVALNSDMVIMNHHAQQSLTSPDRAVLLARTSDADGAVDPTMLVAELPSGILARLDYRPTFLGSELAGGIFRVRLRTGQESGPVHRVERPRLTGLAGTSLSWMRSAAALREALKAQRWAVLDGESGVGKFSLVRAMHYGETPDRHFRMIDSATAADDTEAWLASVADELAGPPGTLVLRHLDQLPDALTGPLSELLIEASARSRGLDGHWVVATRDQKSDHAEVMGRLVPIFDVTINVEPLRHRGEDVRAMAPLMLSQLARSDDISLSSRALTQLQRNPWPGNARQLQQVLRKILTTKRRGVVELSDLPVECMAVGRRILSPLEAMERDAIVQSLVDHGGNKTSAAVDLGMSRATIYRKIREYRITTDS